MPGQDKSSSDSSARRARLYLRVVDERRAHTSNRGEEMRFIILWLLGVPVVVLILLKVFGIL